MKGSAWDYFVCNRLSCLLKPPDEIRGYIWKIWTTAVLSVCLYITCIHPRGRVCSSSSSHLCLLVSSSSSFVILRADFWQAKGCLKIVPTPTQHFSLVCQQLRSRLYPHPSLRSVPVPPHKKSLTCGCVWLVLLQSGGQQVLVLIPLLALCLARRQHGQPLGAGRDPAGPVHNQTEQEEQDGDKRVAGDSHHGGRGQASRPSFRFHHEDWAAASNVHQLQCGVFRSMQRRGALNLINILSSIQIDKSVKQIRKSIWNEEKQLNQYLEQHRGLPLCVPAEMNVYLDSFFKVTRHFSIIQIRTAAFCQVHNSLHWKYTASKCLSEPVKEEEIEHL